MPERNPSNLDTNGTEESVHISEVSLFQGSHCMQELFLGKEKVSLLERCHFNKVSKFFVTLPRQTICKHKQPSRCPPSQAAVQ